MDRRMPNDIFNDEKNYGPGFTTHVPEYEKDSIYIPAVPTIKLVLLLYRTENQ